MANGKKLQNMRVLTEKEKHVKSALVEMGTKLYKAIQTEDANAVVESISTAEKAIRIMCPNLFLGNPSSTPIVSALFRPLQIAILRARTVGVTSDDLNALGVHLEEICGRSESKLIAELKVAYQQTRRMDARMAVQGGGKPRAKSVALKL